MPPLRSFLMVLLVCGCARTRGAELPAPIAPGTQVIPTVYLNERFFARPVTTLGDTVTMLLDTGDNSRFFLAAIERLHWGVDTVQTARGPSLLTTLPEFLPGKGVPTPLPSARLGKRVVVVQPIDKFDTLMSTRTIGQLGQPWFDGRIWTFDYPGRRLLLHSRMPERRAEDREIAFDFRSDTLGRRVNATPRLPVEVDGDTLLLIFDTGATVWLTDSAKAAMRDAIPAERSWSLVRAGTLRKWHQRHPSWLIVERASAINGSDMIEVPSIRLAGIDVGPVWFGTIPDRPASAPPAPSSLRLDGTLGGDALRFFSVTLDYPNRVARFRPSLGAARREAAGGHVEGDLRVHSFLSPTFGNERELRVLVPPGYDAPENRRVRYPVLFLNDGQNLFDSTTSMFNAQEWRVDETVAALTRQGRIPPMIVVGVDNAGRRGRFHEYFPWFDKYLTPPDSDPQGMRYPAFLIDEVLPFISKHYRILNSPSSTGVGGSSAGALAAIRAVLDRPGVFGRLLVESPSLYLDDYHILRDAASVRRWPERVYLGVGTNESNRASCDPTNIAGAQLAMDVGRFANLLRASGVPESNVKELVAPCGRHDEQSWAERLPTALAFLFGPRGN